MRRSLRGRPAGRVAELPGKERLSEQDHQQMAQDVDLRHARIFAGRPGETSSAFEMFESDLNPPTQAIKIANSLGRECRGIEGGDPCGFHFAKAAGITQLAATSVPSGSTRCFSRALARRRVRVFSVAREVF